MLEKEFRFWDKISEEYVNPIAIEKDNNNRVTKIYLADEVINRSIDEFYVMRFSGMYDKKKMPIYVGDVLSTPFGKGILRLDNQTDFIVELYDDRDMKLDKFIAQRCVVLKDQETRT